MIIFGLLLLTEIYEIFIGATPNVGRNEWDMLMLIEQKYKVGLEIGDSDFMLNLTKKTYNFMFPAQTIFSNRILPDRSFIYIKLQPKVKSFTILSITDPDHKQRLHIRGFERRGAFNEYRISIMIDPVENMSINFTKTVEFTVPFMYSSWTIGILFENTKLTFYTNCDDIEKPLGYHNVIKTASFKGKLFLSGATIYLFSDGNPGKNQDKFKGTVSEFILTNHTRIKEFMCRDEAVEGSGTKANFWKLNFLGNILITNATTTPLTTTTPTTKTPTTTTPTTTTPTTTTPTTTTLITTNPTTTTLTTTTLTTTASTTTTPTITTPTTTTPTVTPSTTTTPTTTTPTTTTPTTTTPTTTTPTTTTLTTTTPTTTTPTTTPSTTTTPTTTTPTTTTPTTTTPNTTTPTTTTPTTTTPTTMTPTTTTPTTTTPTTMTPTTTTPITTTTNSKTTTPTTMIPTTTIQTATTQTTTTPTTKTPTTTTLTTTTPTRTTPTISTTKIPSTTITTTSTKMQTSTTIIPTKTTPTIMTSFTTTSVTTTQIPTTPTISSTTITTSTTTIPTTTEMLTTTKLTITTPATSSSTTTAKVLPCITTIPTLSTTIQSKSCTTPTTSVSLSSNNSKISPSDMNDNVTEEAKKELCSRMKGEKGERGYEGYNGSDCDCLKLLRINKPEKGKQGMKGDRGQKGEMGIPGLRGLQGTCSKYKCRSNTPIKGNKGDVGPDGYCSDNLCKKLLQKSKGSKGDKGNEGEYGLKGNKGDKATVPDIIASIIPDVKNSVEDYLIKNNFKGEPGSCSCTNGAENNNKKSHIQTMILNDSTELKALAAAASIGQMVYLIVENVLLIKVDEVKNRWRVIKMDDTQPDWFFSLESGNVLQAQQTDHNLNPNNNGMKTYDTSFKLMLIALPNPIKGDLRSEKYEPGAYSGSSYQCQKHAYNYGLGRAFYPLINTDTFDFTYMVPEKYRYSIPIVNRKNEKIAQSFEDLLKSSIHLLAPILDFKGNSIMSVEKPHCVWIGRKPSLYESKQPTEEGLCLNWMSRRKNSTGSTTRLLIGRPLLDINFIEETPCHKHCRILCMQIYPLMSEIGK